MSDYCSRCGQQIQNSSHTCSFPAYPGVAGIMGYGRSAPVYGPNGEVHWVEYEPGMSKRELVAAIVAAGALARIGPAEGLAKQCVTMADELLKELGSV